ncbi:MAG: hypothetical protein RL653_852 [Pseudomonadota bacterium]
MEAAPPTATRFQGLRARLDAVGRFFATQRHLVAVRDGVVGALPLVLVGSVFLLLAQPPLPALTAGAEVPAWRQWLQDASPTLLIPYRVLGGLVALYVTFSAAYSLARSYALDAAANGLLSVAALLLAAYRLPGAGRTPHLEISRLGAGAIFGGLLVAVATVEITRQFVKRKWTVRLPDTAPDAVVRSFVALAPAACVLSGTFLLVHVAGVDLLRVLEHAARPLVRAADSLPAALAVTAVDGALWLLGVHASAALATLKPLWESMLMQNAEAAAQGLRVLPHTATQPFYLWFAWQGGSGATLPLALLLLRARSTQLRTVGRAGVLPALFNVNEPILFGVPVVLNGTLVVPFLLVPALSVTTAWVALRAGWVTPPYLELPWTLPAPLGAWLSTGGDVRALLLQCFNLGLGLLVYWPFVRRYDRALRAREQGKG